MVRKNARKRSKRPQSSEPDVAELPRSAADLGVLFGRKGGPKDANAEALKEAREVETAGEPSKKKRKGKKKQAIAVVEEQNEKETLVPLTYGTLREGSLVLGVVKDVTDVDVRVSLPNSMTGYLALHEVSEHAKKMVESYVDDDNDEEATLPSLKAMFKPGQSLCCAVRRLDEKKRRLELSLLPSLINATVGQPELQEIADTNTPVLGQISSVEEHGYSVSLGALTGFLPFDKAAMTDDEDEEADKSKPAKLQVGDSVECLVRKVSAKMVQLTRLTEQPVLQTIDSLHTLKPGMRVKGVVKSTLHNGVILVLPPFTAQVMVRHATRMPGQRWRDLVDVGQEVMATILHVNVAQKRIDASLLDLPITLPKVRRGDILEGCRVRRVVQKLGVFLDFNQEGGLEACSADQVSPGSTEAGVSAAFCHVSMLKDGAKVTRIDKDYAPGTVHTARVLDVHPLDGHVVVTLQPSMLAARAMSLRDVQVGDVFEKAEIVAQLSSKKAAGTLTGVIVRLGDKVKALVKARHLSDVAQSDIRRRCRVGQHLKVRVLRVDANRKQVDATAKKSLVEASDAEWVSSWDDVTRDRVLLGVVDQIRKEIEDDERRQGAVVITFAGGVKGVLPKKEVVKAGVTDDLRRAYRKGQLLRVRVANVNREERRMLLSLDLLPPSLHKDKALNKKERQRLREQLQGLDLREGQIVKGVVHKRREDHSVVLVEVSDSKTIECELPHTHVADSPIASAAAAALLTTGMPLTQLVLLQVRQGAQRPLLSMKPLLLAQALADDPDCVKKVHKKKQKQLHALVQRFKKDELHWPTSYADLLRRRNTTVACTVRRVDPAIGVFVAGLGNTVLVAPKSNLSDAFVSQEAAQQRFPEGATVLTRVMSDVHVDKQRAVASFRSSELPRGKRRIFAEAMRLSLDATRVALNVAQIADDAKKSADGKETKRLRRVEVVLKALAEEEARLDREVAKLMQTKQASEDAKALRAGQKVKATVLRAVEGSHLFVGDSKGRVGRVHIAEVNEEFVPLSLNKEFRVRSKLLVKCLGRRRDKSDEYEFSLLNMDSKERVEAEEDGSALPSALPAVGSVVPLYVKRITKSGAFLSLSRDAEARCMLKDLSDSFVRQPAKLFRIGKLVLGRVQSVNEEKRTVSVSLRQSDVAGETRRRVLSRLSVGDCVAATVTNVNPKLGVFVSIDGSADEKGRPLSGLAHISCVSDDVPVETLQQSLGEHFDVGDKVRVVVTKIDTDKCRVSLSLKPSDVEEALNNERFLDESQLRPEVERGDAEVADVDVEDYLVDEDSDEEESSSSDEDADEEEEEEDADEDSEDSEDDENDEGPKGFFSKTLLAQDDSDSDEDSDADSGSDDDDEDTKLSAKALRRQKKAQKDKRMREALRREEALARGEAAPETEADLQRLLATSPNSSFLWTRLMAFHAARHEFDKARETGRNALDRINFREGQERLNVWMALLALEVAHGDAYTRDTVLKEVEKANDRAQVLRRTAQLYAQAAAEEQPVRPSAQGGSNKPYRQLAADVLARLTKHFPEDVSSWVTHAEYLYKEAKRISEDSNLPPAKRAKAASTAYKRARALQTRALQALSFKKKLQVDASLKLALLEHRHGDAERARTSFETLLSGYPRRLDIWTTYADAEAKLGEVKRARRVYERMCSGTTSWSVRRMQYVFRRFLAFEQKHGDEAGVAAVQKKAVQWVKEHTAGDNDDSSGSSDESDNDAMRDDDDEESE